MKDSNVFLTAEEKEMIYIGLNLRKNRIETGDSLLSAVDAKNMGQEKLIKVLNSDQMHLILKIEDLIKKIFE
jgi:hypothetical protein